MACRVTLDPPESAVAESAPPTPSFFTTESRVRSPSAKNTASAARSCAFDMPSHVLGLGSPAPFVHEERPFAAVRRHAVETRFHNREQRSLGGLFQAEFDERRRLVLGVSLRVDPVRDPPETEVTLRFDALDGAERRVL